MGAHAKLSPSSAARWLHCTAAPTLEADFKESYSEYAEEGTAAHAYAEVSLALRLGQLTPGEAKKKTKALDASYAEKWRTGDFDSHVEAYVDYIYGRVQDLAKLHGSCRADLEQRLDISAYVPECWGTGDAVLMAGDTLHVCDLKFGRGVAVSAEKNEQLLLYGLGAYLKYAPVYDFSNVCLTIVQPRLGNVSNYEVKVKHLLQWAETVVKPAAKKAFSGEKVSYCPSEKTCRWCRAKAVCRARADANMELAKHDFASPDTLSHGEIAALLPKIKELIAWGGDVQDYALEQARDHGAVFPGYKLVAGRSARIFSDPEMAEKLLVGTFGHEDLYTTPELLSLAKLEKKLGKKKFADEVGQLVVKTEGKPTLVPDSDKRPALNSAEDAVADFSTKGTAVGDFDPEEVID